MKKFSFLSFVVAIAIALAFTSCKENNTVEEPKFDLSKVNFVADGNSWVLTDFFCYELTQGEDQDVGLFTPGKSLLEFQSERAMYVILKPENRNIVLNFNISWKAEEKYLSIDANTGEDIFGGNVLLTEDAEKVHFQYKGVGRNGDNARYNFRMQGYILKKDLK